MHLGIRSFIQQTFLEGLLLAECYSRCLRYINEQRAEGSCPCRVYVLPLLIITEENHVSDSEIWCLAGKYLCGRNYMLCCYLQEFWAFQHKVEM